MANGLEIFDGQEISVNREFHLKKGESLLYQFAIISQRPVNLALDCRLEAGSKAEISGLTVGRGRAAIGVKSKLHHQEPDSFGRFSLRNVFFDQAISHRTGLIRIEKAAQGSNSYLSDHTLLLSSQARSKTVPSLEIEADQVKASHGSTTGRINPDEEFYLLNRGLTEKAAKELLIEGFLFERFLKLRPADKSRLLRLIFNQ